MNDTKPKIYYIENLTAGAWVFDILPYFLKHQKKALKGLKEIYYFHNSSAGLMLAKATLYFAPVRLRKVFCSRADMKNRDGKLLWMEMDLDAVTVHDRLKDNPWFQKIKQHYREAHRLHLFLDRCAFFHDAVNRKNKTFLMGLIFLIRIIEHRENAHQGSQTADRSVHFFMQKRIWSAALESFAMQKGITIIPIGGMSLFLKAFSPSFDGIKPVAKSFIYRMMIMRHKIKQTLSFKRRDRVNTVKDMVKQENTDVPGTHPRLMVEYYGQLNLDFPGLRSDLFFFQESDFSARDILLYFNLSRDPVTDKTLAEIKKHGMSAIAINLRAAATPHVDIFKYKQNNRSRKRFTYDDKSMRDLCTQRWLNTFIKSYQEKYDFWFDFIKRQNIKIHVTWNKNAPEHYAILDALEDTGGVGTVYQRSFEHFPMLWSTTTADVVFGFSELGAHSGKDRHSVIPYYVVVGYLGDHRFNLWRERANDVRSLLKSNGATKIMAYFDESFSDEVIYQSTVKYYQYLLTKVLECPWFGLILKPKRSKALRSELKPIQELLSSAERTGRCYIFDSEAALHSAYPPAAASLGADVAVHGHFYAAAAGIEAALAGTPTLFLDYEGPPSSPLYRLGDQVIFKDIDPLWKACSEHWFSPGGIPGFGDWSGLLDEIDPFRDGRAAERMGTYLKWLMEGFKAGLPRETVLADAAERYGKVWGKDKVFSINSSPVTRNFDDKEIDPGPKELLRYPT